MKHEDFDKVIEARISLIRSTLASKGGEYSSEDDVFESFKAISNGLSLHDDSTQVLWELLTKHLYSIRKMIESSVAPSKEHMQEKIGDAINYLILLEGIFTEDIQLNQDITASLKIAETRYYNKASVERLSMWTSDYSTNTDMLGLVKMAKNGSDHDIDKLRYNTEGDNGY